MESMSRRLTFSMSKIRFYNAFGMKTKAGKLEVLKLRANEIDVYD